MYGEPQITYLLLLFILVDVKTYLNQPFFVTLALKKLQQSLVLGIFIASSIAPFNFGLL